MDRRRAPRSHLRSRSVPRNAPSRRLLRHAANWPHRCWRGHLSWLGWVGEGSSGRRVEQAPSHPLWRGRLVLGLPVRSANSRTVNRASSSSSDSTSLIKCCLEEDRGRPLRCSSDTLVLPSLKASTHRLMVRSDMACSPCVALRSSRISSVFFSCFPKQKDIRALRFARVHVAHDSDKKEIFRLYSCQITAQWSVIIRPDAIKVIWPSDAINQFCLHDHSDQIKKRFKICVTLCQNATLSRPVTFQRIQIFYSVFFQNVRHVSSFQKMYGSLRSDT